MAKDRMTIKGRDALAECVRMWRLNDTFNGEIVKRGRAFCPGDKSCMWDDESWDRLISSAGCGAAICGKDPHKVDVAGAFRARELALRLLKERGVRRFSRGTSLTGTYKSAATPILTSPRSFRLVYRPSTITV